MAGVIWGSRPLAALSAGGVVLALATVVLTGCGGTPTPETEGDPPAAQEPAPEEGSGEEQEPVNPLAECLEGTWQLDTADFVAQSTAYLQGLGIPLESLAAEGVQQLTFQDDGYFSQATDLTWSASLAGIPLTVPTGSLGEAEWALDGNSLSITDWTWLVAPGEVDTGELPPGMQAPEFPSISLEGLTSGDVECGDTLVLQGDGAPLSGVFVRFDG
jgi:hypothetical protein